MVKLRPLQPSTEPSPLASSVASPGKAGRREPPLRFLDHRNALAAEDVQMTVCEKAPKAEMRRMFRLVCNALCLSIETIIMGLDLLSK